MEDEQRPHLHPEGKGVTAMQGDRVLAAIQPDPDLR